MESILGFVSDNASFLSIMATLIVAVLTLMYVIISSRTLKEMKLSREEETRPYVSVYLRKENRNSLVDVYIKNFGKTGAKIKSIQCTPDIELFGKTLNAAFCNAVLMPGQSIYTVVAKTDDVKTQSRYEVKTRYESIGEKPKAYAEEYALDISYFDQLGYLDTKQSNLSSGENSLRNMAATMEEIGKKIN